MKLAILGLLATGASASFSMRRLQDSSGPHPGNCNIDSDCINENSPEGICVPKAAHSHDHLRRKLFGGVVYSGYCMDPVCMAGESTFYQATAEGIFAGDNSPYSVIQERGWCDDGTIDGWVAYAYSSEAGCSAEVMGQMSGFATLFCYVSDQCPITNMENIFCELRDLPAECEGIYRQGYVESWIASGQDTAAANAYWDSAMSMSLCECGTQGGTRYESDEAQEGDFNWAGWSFMSLCGETYECKEKAWSVTGSDETTFMNMCSNFGRRA
mmetsp:Transcript_30162/g.59916  ORF Transcript_30162/g.59916 Transcript_30162/m.59916 type:complete len:270 (+) Transcript_30162:54-863(+)